MRSGFLVRALVASALLTAIAAGCGRPDDHTWLQFLGFKQSEEYVSVINGKLKDGNTNTADAEFQNTSYLVGSDVSDIRSGVLIQRARVEYSLPDLQPPASEYTLNLYLPPSHTSGTAISTSDTETIADFPLAPASLKSWIIGTGAYPNGRSVSLQAKVTFFAETDEGTDLETTGGISIELSNP